MLQRWASTAASGTTIASNGNSPWAQRYARELRDVVFRYAARSPRTLQRHLGPSELGQPCDRQVITKMAGPAHILDTNHISDPWASIVGTAIHAFLEEAFGWDSAEGPIKDRWLTERRVTPDPASPEPHPGTADLYDATTRTLVDHKGQGEGVRAKLRAQGPPVHYRMQMLLYAAGYMHEGFPVDRVALVSWPRTKSTLDDMYVWEHVLTGEDLEEVVALIEKTKVREDLAKFVAAGELDWRDIPATPSDEGCHYCWTGNTEITTRDGIKPIGSLVGTSPELLVPALGYNGARKSLGTFQKNPVSCFGEQEVFSVNMSRGLETKVVEATADHGWFLASRKVRGRFEPQVRKTTLELAPGDQLQPIRRASPSEPVLMPIAVAQGFVFGDGTRNSDRHERPASLSIYDNGKDSALLRFFPGEHKRYAGAVPYTYVSNLPRFWKELPPIRESRGFLLSWLAGYFAADGCVATTGSCRINSARESNVRFVRDVAAVCGIDYGRVRSQSRIGFPGREPSYLWGISLRRQDLPSWFFLIDEHRRRAASVAVGYERLWRITSVEATGHVEPVYCATVEGVAAFGMEGSFLSGNCPLYRPQAAYDPEVVGCPGTVRGPYGITKE